MKFIEVQGVTIPRLGFGTFGLNGSEGQAAIEGAMACGYRHIDTAARYGNEDAVGAAIAASALPRIELFVTTKVWLDSLAPEALRRSFENSLSKLGTDYVDLFMIHWPTPDMDLAATLKAMMALRDSGRARAIGVCNFTLPLLRRAVEEIGAPIAANQVEYHPFLDQSRLIQYLRDHGGSLIAYAPLAQGHAVTDATLQRLAKKHGVTAAQITVAWLMDQAGVLAIPKAAGAARQMANLYALKVALDDEDRQAIAALPKDGRYVSPPFAPDWNVE